MMNSRIPSWMTRPRANPNGYPLRSSNPPAGTNGPPPAISWEPTRPTGGKISRTPATAPAAIVRPDKRNYKPKPSTSAGSLHFNGYQWLCPACGKACRTLYLPVGPINLLKRSQPRLAHCVDIPQTKLAGTFACKHCHGVRYFTSLGKGGWNDLISYLTGGLLYGREVPKPAWFKPQRKIAYRPHPNAPPSKRRPQVTELLMEGLSNGAIAKTLGISSARSVLASATSTPNTPSPAATPAPNSRASSIAPRRTSGEPRRSRSASI